MNLKTMHDAIVKNAKEELKLLIQAYKDTPLREGEKMEVIFKLQDIAARLRQLEA